VDSTAPVGRFRSCLLIAPPDAETFPFVRALHSAGIAVLERTPGPGAAAMALSGEFDLVAYVCEPGSTTAPDALRRIAAANVPVIALLRDLTPVEASTCLVAGADACLQLDADSRLVVAQVHAILRRRSPDTPEDLESCGLLKVGDLTVDMDRCEVERAGEFISLTATEFRIVAHMARHAGRVLKPHEILNAVSDECEYLPREAQELFKVYVRRIRRKLEPTEAEPRYLITARGFGYRLEGGSARSQTRFAATQIA